MNAPAATTIYGFILFTFVQILVFLCYPQLYHSSAPEIDTPPTFANFRLIGIQECGLILIYCGIAWTNDRTLMKMTVFGRMSSTFAIGKGRPGVAQAEHGLHIDQSLTNLTVDRADEVERDAQLK